FRGVAGLGGRRGLRPGGAAGRERGNRQPPQSGRRGALRGQLARAPHLRGAAAGGGAGAGPGAGRRGRGAPRARAPDRGARLRQGTANSQAPNPTGAAATAGGSRGEVMDYNSFFAAAVNRLKVEQRYRVFVDLERIAGRFPHAIWHSPTGPREVVIWCSNDYLGMGQHPNVVGAMVATAACFGAGAGGTRNIAGTNHPLVKLELELADLHPKEAPAVSTPGYVSNPTRIRTI